MAKCEFNKYALQHLCGTASGTVQGTQFSEYFHECFLFLIIIIIIIIIIKSLFNAGHIHYKLFII